MSNENTTASQMQHPELSAKNNVNPDANDTTVEIATLRVRITHLESLNTLLHEQIQRLREQNFALNDEAKELHNMVDDLSGWVAGVEADNDTLRKDIARLRKERDAARRDFCAASYDDPHLVARERGWDCFKEESK
jgi:chromosome segregation ATPase